MDIKNTLSNAVKALVSRPDSVSVKESELERATLYTVKTDERDYGRVVGAKAKSYFAFELVTKLMAAQSDREARLIVEPPPEFRQYPREQFAISATWGKADLDQLIRPIAGGIFRGGTLEIKEPDKFNLTAEIKVNANDQYSVIRDGDYVSEFKDESHERKVIDTDLIQKALRVIFHAIGKAQGRNVNVDVIPIYFRK